MKKLEADVACKKCKKKFMVELSYIRLNKSTKCPKCNSIIYFNANDRHKVQKLFSDCDRAIKDFKKLIKI